MILILCFFVAQGIAFDMMRVALTDLPHLPGTVPALRALLVEEEGAEEGIM